MKPQIPDLLHRIRISLETGQYRQTHHAIQRMIEYEIPLPDVLFALRRGKRKVQYDLFDDEFNQWNYAIEGNTPDNKKVRIITSFDERAMLLIITVIDLYEEGI